MDALQSLRTYQTVANRLVDLAAQSVRSFYVPFDQPDDEGMFLRDSLMSRKDVPVSTGGLGVICHLYEVDRYFSYLSRNNISDHLDDLRSSRDASLRHFINPENKPDVPSALGIRNPLSFSYWAYLGTIYAYRNRWNARGAVAAAVNIDHFISFPWPTLQNVETAHPYVAYNVLRPIRMLLREPNVSSALLFKLKNMKGADFDINHRAKKGAKQYEHVAKRVLKNSENENYLLGAIEHSRENAVRYLGEQVVASPLTREPSNESPDYDPVGACFALRILLESYDIGRQPTEAVQDLLAEHENLIELSIRHILESLTLKGSWHAAMPFYYSESGMGAFPPSVTGLAALSYFLLQILEYSRKSDYPSRRLLHHIFLDNHELMAKLYSLCVSLESSHQQNDDDLQGWSTDRAPSRTRVESWVSVEVLLFAVHIRELLQEVTQLSVYDQYGAFLPVREPRWPYQPGADELTENTRDEPGPHLDDPDIDGNEAINESSANADASQASAIRSEYPIQFLHHHFSKFMEKPDLGVPPDWNSDISSVLFFGPPGVAKTTIAKSLAQELKWHFIELSPSDLIIDGLELIERKATELFENLSTLRETVVLFDEMDSLFVDRDSIPFGNILSFLVPAMLPKLQRLSSIAKRRRLLIVIATNFYDRLDSAIVRRGRIDKHLLILPCSDGARKRVMTESLAHQTRELGLSLERTSFQIDDLVKNSRLYTFLEMQEYTRRVATSAKAGGDIKADVLPPSISSSLYLSRMGNKEVEFDQTATNRRLAFEVCEVVGRFLGKPRYLVQDATWPTIRDRARVLLRELGDQGGEAEWTDLIRRLEGGVGS